MTESLPTDLGQQLAAAGAVPFVPDAESLLAQLQQMQASQDALMARIKSLETERGVPSDPVAGAVKDITDHVTARTNQYPQLDSTEILDYLKNLPEESVQFTRDHADLMRVHIESLLNNHSQIKHELAYLTELGLNLSKAVLSAAVA